MYFPWTYILYSIISCFTDDELDPLAEQITTENRKKITLQHDTVNVFVMLMLYKPPSCINRTTLFRP